MLVFSSEPRTGCPRHVFLSHCPQREGPRFLLRTPGHSSPGPACVSLAPLSPLGQWEGPCFFLGTEHRTSNVLWHLFAMLSPMWLWVAPCCLLGAQAMDLCLSVPIIPLWSTASSKPRAHCPKHACVPLFPVQFFMAQDHATCLEPGTFYPGLHLCLLAWLGPSWH